MKKLIYATAFGIGYVLGTRAGRERYEQIRDAAERVQSDPRLRDAVHKAEAFAEDAVHAVADEQRRSDLVGSVKETAQNVRAQAAGAAAAVRETVEQVAEDDRVRDAAGTAKHVAQDVAEKAKDVADDDAIEDAVGTAQEVAGEAKQAAERTASEATQKIKAAADEARGSSTDAQGETWPPHPDEHIPEVEDEVAYTTGPDDKS